MKTLTPTPYRAATTAILLAAGLGTRLAPLTRTSPKCLTLFEGEPMLGRAINALQRQGISHVVVVAGYLSDYVREYINRRGLSDTVEIVLNPEYARTGTAASLQCGLTMAPVESDVLVVEADVVFEDRVLEQVLETAGSAAAIAAYRPDLTGTFAIRNAEGVLTDWVHESQRERDFRVVEHWKTVNITRFSSADVQQRLMLALAEVRREYGDRAPFEYAARYGIKRLGMALKGVDVSLCRWYEVDTMDDLERARRIFQTALLTTVA